jgi:hypothetical protein
VGGSAGEESGLSEDGEEGEDGDEELGKIDERSRTDKALIKD